MNLDDWIDQRHFAPEVQASYARKFASVPYSSVAIDNFLRPEKLAALQRVFSAEGRFDDRYSVWDAETKSEKAVPKEAWYAASPDQRAAAVRILAGEQPEHRLGQGIIAQFKFHEMLGSSEFMCFLRAVTGIKPVTLTSMTTRVLMGGHYIAPHNDAQPDRDLCAVLYASPHWRPSFGGRFRHCGPGREVVPVEPRPNRLLVFQPRFDCLHDVELITAAGAHWQRWTYSLWFGTPDGTAP